MHFYTYVYDVLVVELSTHNHLKCSLSILILSGGEWGCNLRYKLNKSILPPRFLW